MVDELREGAAVEMSVGARLRYSMEKPTWFVFQIEAAKADSQVISSETLHLPPNDSGTPYETYCDPVTMTRKVRALLGPGAVEVIYEASVEIDSTGFDPADVREFDFATLPMAYLDYITPSRYCPSDTFTDFAHDTFGACPRGHQRVTAVADWIHGHLRYESGSTGSWSNAADVFHSRQGVCRDFAHLGISLCRALGIPARYASVYADALKPQDFHAVFQAYLDGPKGGEWFSFDATRMSSVDSLVRIAAGQDAADVAFAWPQGEVSYEAPHVTADAHGRDHTRRTTLAIGN
jgi:transglutaminase-like putative cysteine protease